MRELEQARSKLASAIAGNGGGYVSGDLRATAGELTGLAEAVAACVERLEEIGVVVKDPDGGLVDFPARRHGRDVLLCWHVGEDEVSYWHDLEAGFAGRRPVDWLE